MKWIKIVLGSLLGIVLLCTVALTVAGMGADSNRGVSSVVIRQSAAAIWPWLIQPDKVKQWVSWMVEARGEREAVVGSKVVWVMEDRNNNNQKMEIVAVVGAVEPNRRLVLNLASGDLFHGVTTYTLTELAGGSTKLESDARYTFDNGFARFMLPLVLWQANKKTVSDLEHLRSLVEGK